MGNQNILEKNTLRKGIKNVLNFYLIGPDYPESEL